MILVIFFYLIYIHPLAPIQVNQVALWVPTLKFNYQTVYWKMVRWEKTYFMGTMLCFLHVKI